MIYLILHGSILAEETEEEKEKKKVKAKAREEFFAAIKMEGKG